MRVVRPVETTVLSVDRNERASGHVSMRENSLLVQKEQNKGVGVRELGEKSLPSPVVENLLYGAFEHS